MLAASMTRPDKMLLMPMVLKALKPAKMPLSTLVRA